MQIFTIGFTKKKAETFFSMLIENKVRRVIDVRLRNRIGYVSHALVPDIAYFLRLLNIGYVEKPLLAPTADLLDGERSGRLTWQEYTAGFQALMAQRRIESVLDPAEFDGACLLCSEDLPHQCHRSLVADHLKRHWGSHIEIVHLHNPSPTKPETSRRTTGRANRPHT